MWNTAVIVVLGFWMIVAPFLLPDPPEQAWNSRIIGILTSTLAAAVPRAYRWEVFAAMAAGAWLVASSFVPALLMNGGMLWNDMLVGALVIATGMRATMKTRERIAPQLPP